MHGDYEEAYLVIFWRKIGSGEVDYAAGLDWEVSMDVLFPPWKLVPIGIHSSCCESKLTTASILHEGASYKTFLQPF